MSSDQKHCPGAGPSGRAVENFSPYCEGDIDPTLNKRIHMLVDSEDTYIVYLDDDFHVQWSMTDDWKQPDAFGDIANRVVHLEAVSSMILADENQKPLRRMLGEAAARIIGDSDAKQARASLALAEAFLRARGAERARIWYFGAAAMFSGSCVLILTVLWVCRADVASMIGANAFNVLTGALLGGIGAFFAIITNSRASKLDASAGPRIHQLDGVLRVGAGIAGAFLLSLAIKANIIFGVAKTFDSPLAAFYTLCFVAGWSERFSQSLVTRVEGLISGKAPAIKHDQEGSDGE
ncbi:MAG: hypothetical protein ACHP7O_02935 [Burkholderiales bacterium]